MELAREPRGTIWITSLSSGVLLSLNPNTGKFTTYYAPSSSGLYGLAITSTGQVWVTIAAENVLARLDIVANRFIYYAIPTRASLLLGVVIGAHNTLWFTKAASNKVGMLQPWQT